MTDNARPDTAEAWIEMLDLEPHPEGGWYRETWRSSEPLPVEALPGRYRTGRSFGSLIYFLLTADNPSRFHALDSDELWFWHAGAPTLVHALDEDGGYARRRLGDGRDASLQLHLAPDTHFAAEVEMEGGYSLVSCVVVPGFSFEGFRLSRPDELLSRWPMHQDLIARLTRGS